MAEFNYTIPIPQPNTNMFGGGFFQGLQAIEGIRSARAQQELARQLAPLQLQQAELGVQSQRQQMAQSEAAATREASRFQDYTAQREADRELAFALSEGKSPSEIARLLPFASAEFASKFPQVAQANMASRVGPIIQQGGPKSEEDVQEIRNAVSTSLMLAPAQAQMFQKVFAASPDPTKTNFVKEVLSIGYAGLRGDNKTALKKLSDYSTALSANPETKQLGEMLKQKLDEAKSAEEQGLLNKTSWFIDISSLAQSLDPQAAKQFDDLADNYFKFQKTSAETQKDILAAKKATRELDATPTRTLNEVDKKILTAESSIPIGFTSDTYDVLKRFENARIENVGVRAKISDFFTNAGMGGDEVTKLRNEIDAIIKGDSFRKYAALNKGSSSDKDVKIAQGFNISATAKPELVKQALTAIINTAERASRFEEAEKAWAREIGMIEKSKEDMDILGVKVKKGDNYAAFKDNLLKELRRANFVDEIGRQKEQDQKETEVRTMESKKLQKGAGPDFTGNEQDSLLKAAEVLRRLKTQ
jgi:hypothetical protein